MRNSFYLNLDLQFYSKFRNNIQHRIKCIDKWLYRVDNKWILLHAATLPYIFKFVVIFMSRENSHAVFGSRYYLSFFLHILFAYTWNTYFKLLILQESRWNQPKVTMDFFIFFIFCQSDNVKRTSLRKDTKNV